MPFAYGVAHPPRRIEAVCYRRLVQWQTGGLPGPDDLMLQTKSHGIPGAERKHSQSVMVVMVMMVAVVVVAVMMLLMLVATEVVVLMMIVLVLVAVVVMMMVRGRVDDMWVVFGNSADTVIVARLDSG